MKITAETAHRVLPRILEPGKQLTHLARQRIRSCGPAQPHHNQRLFRHHQYRLAPITQHRKRAAGEIRPAQRSAPVVEPELVAVTWFIRAGIGRRGTRDPARGQKQATTMPSASGSSTV